ncbi:MAG: hypothetical protein J6B23_00185 [Clostridia bacterium]|nr:hypothetical protein [Clostridia bacterium]
MNQDNQYTDIINMHRPFFGNRKKMSNHDRAAQFAPFAALTGYDDAVNETARLTDSASELDEYEIEQLDRKLFYLKEHISDNIEIEITYFVPDSKKAGGEYKKTNGFVVKIKDFEKELIMSGGEVIPVDKIFDIESKAFETMENIITPESDYESEDDII